MSPLLLLLLLLAACSAAAAALDSWSAFCCFVATKGKAVQKRLKF